MRIKEGFSGIKKGVTLIILLLFLGFSTYSQQFYDDENRVEESFWAIGYDSIFFEYNFYFFSSMAGSASLNDSATALYRLTVDSDMNPVDTTKIFLPDIGLQHFQQIQKDDFWNDKFVVRTGNFSKTGNSNGSWYFNHESNYHLCEIVNDSLKILKSLLPENAYAARYYGVFEWDNQPAFLLRWAESQSDSTVSFSAIKYNEATNTLSAPHTIGFDFTFNKPYLNGTFYFEPHSRPVRLASGGWGAILSGLNTGFLHLAHLNSSFDSIIGSQIIQAEFNYLQENCWQLGNKLYAYETGDSLDPDDNPIVDYRQLPTIYEYDLDVDSITNEFYFKPLGFEEENSIKAAYTSHFDGEHFVLGAIKRKEFFSNYEEEILLAVFDTGFNLLNYVSIKDTSSFNMWGGFTHVINDPANKDAFIYYGSAEGGPQIPFENGLDIFWGRISANPVGIDEIPFEIKRKELWMYPNPAKEGKFTLKNTATHFEPYKITIYNATGVEVFEETIKSETTLVETDLPIGSYILKSENGDVIQFIVP